MNECKTIKKIKYNRIKFFKIYSFLIKNLKYSPIKHIIVHSEYNKYGLYSGYKKHELKSKYGYSLLKKNNRTDSSISQDEELVIKNNSKSPKNQNQKNKIFKLPKIKQKLKLIYKENPEINKKIIKLKNNREKDVNLEKYQLKLIDLGKRFLDDENLKNLANRFKEISDIAKVKEKEKYHKTPNRWELMVKTISRYLPEYLVDKLKSQK